MTCKRADTACHNVHNRVRDMIFLDMITTGFKRCYIIINSLCRTDLWNIYFEAVRIMKFKLMVIDSSHIFKLCLIHAPVTVRLAGNMVFYMFIILVILCQLIYKCFVATICA